MERRGETSPYLIDGIIAIWGVADCGGRRPATSKVRHFHLDHVGKSAGLEPRKKKSDPEGRSEKMRGGKLGARQPCWAGCEREEDARMYLVRRTQTKLV